MVIETSRPTAQVASLKVDEKKYAYPVTFMCAHLSVSTSGFYEWRSRPELAAEEWRGYLRILVRKAFDDSDGTYGYRRIHAQLGWWDVAAGPELVRSVMRELGLVAGQPKPWRFSLTEQGTTHP